jgi:hypothetical protein
MNVKEIVQIWLRDNGYDGLYNTDAPCGCELDDLFCCDCCSPDCKPGYRVDVKDLTQDQKDRMDIWIDSGYVIMKQRPKGV